MLKNISVKSALGLSFAFMLFAIVALSAYLFVALNGVGAQFGSVVDKNVNLLSSISDLRYYTVTYRRFALDYGLTTSAEEHRKILRTIEYNDRQVEQALNRMLELAASGDVGRFVNDYRRQMNAYRRMQEDYIALIDQGQMTAARAQMLGPMLAPFNAIVDLLTEIQQRLVEDAEALRAQEMAGIERLLLSVVIICLMLAAATAFMGVALSRKVRRPLLQLAEQMRRVETGDLSVPLDRSRFAQDELGVLAGHFANMQAGIRQLVSDMAESVTSLEAATQHVRALQEQAAHGLQAQQTEISQIAAGMNQMQGGFEEVSRGTAGTAEAARLAAEEAASGTRDVQQAVARIEQVAGSIETAGEVIQALREDSVNIGAVSDVIRTVAEQTNLLALNAAIEAARAGEQGRGFAVVAEEVRTLAQRTRSSVAEIADTITVLQERAETAQQAMQDGQAGMRDGVSQARQAGAAIVHINEAIARISEMGAQVAAATEQQTAVAGGLNDSTASIHRVAEEVVHGARESSAACAELEQLANKLKRVSGRFSL